MDKDLTNSQRSAPVTVIMPCYRCANTVERAIESVFSQSLKPSELILVDDASNDGTLSVLNKISAQHESIRLLSQGENLGAASARNRGWDQAAYPFVAFIDSDDAWHPWKLEIQYAYMSEHPEIVLSGHGHRILQNNPYDLSWKLVSDTISTCKISKSQLLLSNRFITPSVMLRRDIPFRFKEGKRHMEDHLLWMEISCAGLGVAKINADLAAIFKAPFGVSGLSGQLKAMESGELANYCYLYQQKYINALQWISLSVYSLLKYLRRLVVTANRT